MSPGRRRDEAEEAERENKECRPGKSPILGEWVALALTGGLWLSESEVGREFVFQLGGCRGHKDGLVCEREKRRGGERRKKERRGMLKMRGFWGAGV